MEQLHSLRRHNQRVDNAYTEWQQQPCSLEKEAAYNRALKAQALYLRKTIDHYWLKCRQAID